MITHIWILNLLSRKIKQLNFKCWKTIIKIYEPTFFCLKFCFTKRMVRNGSVFLSRIWQNSPGECRYTVSKIRKGSDIFLKFSKIKKLQISPEVSIFVYVYFYLRFTVHKLAINSLHFDDRQIRKSFLFTVCTLGWSDF